MNSQLHIWTTAETGTSSPGLSVSRVWALALAVVPLQRNWCLQSAESLTRISAWWRDREVIIKGIYMSWWADLISWGWRTTEEFMWGNFMINSVDTFVKKHSGYWDVVTSNFILHDILFFTFKEKQNRKNNDSDRRVKSGLKQGDN